MQTENYQITKNKAILESRIALKKFTLALTVRRLTTDANGEILNDAVVPIAQRKAFPFHLFADFDKNGGYNISDSILSGIENTILFGSYVWGIGTPLFFFNPLATINNQIKKGDLVFIYVDEINAPTYFHFVIVSAMAGGYGSLVSLSNTTQLDENGIWGVFKFFNVRYSWLNDEQLKYSLFNIQTFFNGAYKHDQVQPEAYRYTQNKPEVRTIIIELGKVVNQYYGLSSLIAWENPLLILSFNIHV